MLTTDDGSSFQRRYGASAAGVMAVMMIWAVTVGCFTGGVGAYTVGTRAGV